MNLKTILAILILSVAFVVPVHAEEKEAGEAAKLASGAAIPAPKSEDIRVAKLRAYLKHVNSPMEPYADVFINEADFAGIDWRLVPAIAGLESGFGKHIPTGSYNAYGWGVFTGQSSGANFTSWEEGIAEVSWGLRKNYYDDGLTSVDAIANRYAASTTWAPRIKFFMNEFDAYHDATVDKSLVALTL